MQSELALRCQAIRKACGVHNTEPTESSTKYTTTTARSSFYKSATHETPTALDRQTEIEADLEHLLKYSLSAQNGCGLNGSKHPSARAMALVSRRSRVARFSVAEKELGIRGVKVWGCGRWPVSWVRAHGRCGRWWKLRGCAASNSDSFLAAFVPRGAGGDLPGFSTDPHSPLQPDDPEKRRRCPREPGSIVGVGCRQSFRRVRSEPFFPLRGQGFVHCQ